jgi:hypothetical protein
MASKPSERFVWAVWACCVACDGEISSLRGYETGTFWDGRALADTRDVSRHSLRRAPYTGA